MTMLQSREKGGGLSFLPGFLWADERLYYLQISIQIVTLVSLVCATSEIVFGCWSLQILSSKVHPKMEISSTKSKHDIIGVAIFVTLTARIIALIIWIRSTRNENLKCYSITSHCTFLSTFVMIGLGGLLIYFLSASLNLATGTFRPQSEVPLAFVYVAGFDILFSVTFGFAVVSDLQCKIRREWDYGGKDESWVRPCRLPNAWKERGPVHEFYV